MGRPTRLQYVSTIYHVLKFTAFQINPCQRRNYWPCAILVLQTRLKITVFRYAKPKRSVPKVVRVYMANPPISAPPRRFLRHDRLHQVTSTIQMSSIPQQVLLKLRYGQKLSNAQVPPASLAASECAILKERSNLPPRQHRAHSWPRRSRRPKSLPNFSISSANDPQASSSRRILRSTSRLRRKRSFAPRGTV